MTEALTDTNLQGALPLVARGKVRDLYEVDDKTLLFVATDRISAYDVIMENVCSPKDKRYLVTWNSRLCGDYQTNNSS